MTQAIKDRWLRALRGGGYAAPEPSPLPDGKRTAFQHLVATTGIVSSSSDDAPIPALLPRDWPRQVDALCDLLVASPYAADLAKQLVDSWVEAATEADQRTDPDDVG
jgi:hypothetical protein